MTAGALDLVIEQGATFRHTLTFHTYDATAENNAGDPVDLTGYTARMHIRKKKNTDTYIIALTTENGRIALGDDAGTVTLYISAEDTANLDFSSGVYDLELEKTGEVIRLVEGAITLSKEVTR